MAACISAATPSSFILSSELLPSKGDKPISVSWSSSFQPLKLSIPTTSSITLNKFEDGGNLHANVENNKQDTRFEGKGLVVEAAWTRRSRSEAAKRPNRKSWKQRTDMYMRPFLLNIFFSKRFIHAKVMHRATSKVISVATTNSRDLRNTLPSLTDNSACRVIGKLIAERSKEADVFAMSYEPNKNERIEGRLAIILDTIEENDIIFV